MLLRSLLNNNHTKPTASSVSVVTKCLSRFNSSSTPKIACSTSSKTHPTEESSKVLRHLHFSKPGIPFNNGLEIQEQIVRAQLDMKKIESGIYKRLNELHKNNLDVNSYEKELLKNILDMKPNPVILTFEFESTYTAGKRVRKQITEAEIKAYENFRPQGSSLSESPTKFIQLDRGGQITYHGPGQMVAFMIFDLKSFNNFPARCFVNGIEEATINCFDQLGIKAERTKNTGVWSKTNAGKLASIGVHVRRNITSHGVCINVSPNLDYLNHFVMCGLPDAKATSIAELQPKGDKTPSVDEIAMLFTNKMAKVLGINKVERILIDSHTLE
ncbi:related to Octanoyltransferase, mitochondrial [Saccharomycodes ludwigii]|uniref:lipoyl(octanoyl) transferase n=1 Tax=Saccharomycodes ludwigii TaxID=36035 RepID=A0A376B0Z0_9ASCO|nr:hypothetical protein SCDLUD_001878 [Saccharomycodes ludwigii]KAH3902067.1 hypothetical protein SCDLUD_001878 [Saccharomycodes ludwigii]SSD58299.1 related to Octanoyltransferase, mitochondrial [Saccharomycodes ludwigii]